MNSVKKVGDLEVEELKNIIHEKVRAIPPDYFMAAVDKRLVNLGKELTGKDIDSNNDVLCIRKTFDNSQRCRQDKEVSDKAFINGKVRLIFGIISLYIVNALTTFFMVKGG